MMLQGDLPVGGLDVVRAGSLLDAERFVVRCGGAASDAREEEEEAERAFTDCRHILVASRRHTHRVHALRRAV